MRVRVPPSVQKDPHVYYVYALRSLTRNYIYVGLTDNLERRVYQHNHGLSTTTKPYAPFALIWSRSFLTRADARRKEKYLKSGIGKEFLRGLAQSRGTLK